MHDASFVLSWRPRNACDSKVLQRIVDNLAPWSHHSKVKILEQSKGHMVCVRRWFKMV